MRLFDGSRQPPDPRRLAVPSGADELRAGHHGVGPAEQRQVDWHQHEGRGEQPLQAFDFGVDAHGFANRP